MNLSVLIPLCDLQPNLQRMQEVLVRALRNLSLEFEVLICDDTASSESNAMCKSIKDRNMHAKIFLHNKKLGLGPSLRELFGESKGEIILYVNSRIFFDYQGLAIFLNSIRECDVVVASHYKAKEGEASSIGFGARLYSFFCCFLLGIPICEVIPDLMVLRRKVAEALPLKASGEDFFLEFLAQAHNQGFSIKEIPSGFPPQKRNGFSRLFAALDFRKKMMSS